MAQIPQLIGTPIRDALAGPLQSASSSASSAPPAITSSSATKQQATLSFDEVIVLKTSERYRCAILTVSAQGAITAALPNGETKTFTKETVVYAGPASSAPSIVQPSPAPTASASAAAPVASGSSAPVAPSAAPALINDGESTLTFESADPDTTFHIRSGNAVVMAQVGTGMHATQVPTTIGAYTTICTAPCTAKLRNGTYTIGLSYGGGVVTEASPPIRVERDAKLKGQYNYNYPYKLALMLSGIGLLGGASVLVATAPNCDVSDHDCEIGNRDRLIGGAAMIGLGFAAILTSFFIHDSADVQYAKGSLTKRIFFGAGSPIANDGWSPTKPTMYSAGYTF